MDATYPKKRRSASLPGNGKFLSRLRLLAAWPAADRGNGRVAEFEKAEEMGFRVEPCVA